MITIYGVYRSRALRPIWLLTETSTPFEHVPVIQAYRLSDPSAPDAPRNTASPEFLKVNPAGQVPAMTEEGLVLTESLAITLHLARRHGGTLGPADETELALMENWALVGATAVETPALEIMYVVNAGSESTPEGAAAIEAAAERLRRPLRRLEAHFDAQSHCVGGRFTVADLNMAECLRYAQGHSTLLSEFPETRRWLEACQARPAFRTVWERRQAEPL
jgi:glutathione S-transferase